MKRVRVGRDGGQVWAWVWRCLLVTAVVVAAGCGSGGGQIQDPAEQPAPEPEPTTKSATIAADFKVSPGTIQLNWQNGETVAWQNDSDSPIVIRFHTPDHEIAEVVKPHSRSAAHRAVAKGIHGYKIYKVEMDGSLTDTSGDPPAEPKIDVGP